MKCANTTTTLGYVDLEVSTHEHSHRTNVQQTRCAMRGSLRGSLRSRSSTTTSVRHSSSSRRKSIKGSIAAEARAAAEGWQVRCSSRSTSSAKERSRQEESNATAQAHELGIKGVVVEKEETHFHRGCLKYNLVLGSLTRRRRPRSDHSQGCSLRREGATHRHSQYVSAAPLAGSTAGASLALRATR